MNLVELFTGLFRGIRFNGQLDKAYDQGRKDTRAIYSRYLDGVQDEADQLLQERQRKLIGVESEGRVVKKR